MNNILIALEKWLNAVFPLVTDALVDILTPETLTEMSNEQGVHVPIVIGLEEFRAPITGLNFYVMVVEETMMFATTIRTKENDSCGDISFDMVFTTTAFPDEINQEENQNMIKDRILKLFEQNYAH